MEALFINNLRCFADVGWTPLAPLTLLVGENSTGKTSFLAAMRIAWDLAHSQTELNFNEEPFQLGAFDQLAHIYGGAKGRAKTIELGHRVPGNEGFEMRTILVQDGSQALVASSTLGIDGTSVTLSRSGKLVKLSFEHRPGQQGQLFPKATRNLEIDLPGNRVTWAMVPYFLMRGGKSSKAEQMIDRWFHVSRRLRSPANRPYAFAPVRTKPLRTYDPIRLAPHPEGEHIPMQLARMRFTDEGAWQQMRSGLERFGKAAGLFEYLDVRTLGKSESDPFQLRVKVAGPMVNLIDVGYGVSQVLPLLVETLSAENRLLLMQQPEVHLHPRAQAELGSFLGTLIKVARKRFVVETHSDYTIDRIRSDIRDKKSLRPEDVAILYFERKKGSVHVHRLTIDAGGNIVGAPKGYRDFFLMEQRRSLGL